MREVDVAKPVIDWFKEDGWDVYQEVECGGGVADVVATYDDTWVWIVETKTSFTFNLIDQARDRLRCAHWVSVACPSARRSQTAYWALRYFGIGLILTGKYDRSLTESIEPRTNRAGARGARRLIERLEPEHQTYAEAGGPHGRRWTPFKSTCRNAFVYVKKHGPVPMRQLVKGIKHHYQSHPSACTTLFSRIDAGIVPGLRLDRSTRPALVACSGKGDIQPKLL